MNTMNINIMMQHEFNSSWASSLPSHDRAPEPTDCRILHPKKGQIGISFLGQLWILRWDPWAWTGSLRSTYQGEILSLWLTGCPPKSPLRGHFPPQWMNRRVTLESDTRAWHKSVTQERDTTDWNLCGAPKSEIREWDQIVKLGSEWHKRVKKENDTTRGDSREHSENKLERTHGCWMCYI